MWTISSFRSLALFAFVIASSLAAYADEQIHLPMTPAIELPDQPTSSPIGAISNGQIYVVESTIPLISLQAPDGLLNIVTASGPLSVFGLFVDGGTTPELRKYTSQNLLIVTGIKPGKTELILVPVGVTDQADIVRQVLTVSGEGPQPPPGPTPGPEPTPDPDPQPVKSFRVIFVKESGATLNAAQSAIPGAKAIRDYLTAKTTPEGNLSGWREYDPDQDPVNDQPTMRALWQTVKPQLLAAPCLVIEKDGKATVMPFPANADECLAKLKEYGG